ncbi:hypothetical protein CLFO_17730 [Clostridium formicaceticum]|uniref:Uncharacterized protein n=1 Tax=Clostridium formicaceticum TaxID=1497 RepID=A0AAC9WG01_9CLOT|nr:hypothetical protein CLFO_17730 [Clostridium formicaceticum]
MSIILDDNFKKWLFFNVYRDLQNVVFARCVGFGVLCVVKQRKDYQSYHNDKTALSQEDIAKQSVQDRTTIKK